MPNFPILGFVAGTPLLTADGPKRIEDIKPGDMIQGQPDDGQDDEPHADDGQDDGELPWWECN